MARNVQVRVMEEKDCEKVYSFCEVSSFLNSLMCFEDLFFEIFFNYINNIIFLLTFHDKAKLIEHYSI